MKARCYICAGDADISPYTEHEKAVKRIESGTYPDQAQAMALNMVLAKSAIDSMFELKVVK